MAKIFTQADIKIPTPRKVSSIGIVRNEDGILKLYFSKDPGNRAKAYAKKGLKDISFIDLGSEMDKDTAVLEVVTSKDADVQTILNSPDHFQILHDYMEKNNLLETYEAMMNIQQTEEITDENLDEEVEEALEV